MMSLVGTDSRKNVVRVGVNRGGQPEAIVQTPDAITVTLVRDDFSNDVMGCVFDPLGMRSYSFEVLDPGLRAWNLALEHETYEALAVQAIREARDVWARGESDPDADPSSKVTPYHQTPRSRIAA